MAHLNARWVCVSSPSGSFDTSVGYISIERRNRLLLMQRSLKSRVEATGVTSMTFVSGYVSCHLNTAGPLFLQGEEQIIRSGSRTIALILIP
jgi:hypothetical protein